MWLQYDEGAREAGITIVSAAVGLFQNLYQKSTHIVQAYDSVPADLGVLAANQAIKAQGSTPTNVEMLFRLRAGDSGLGSEHFNHVHFSCWH